MPAISPTADPTAQLELIERRLEAILRDLRIYRGQISLAQQSQGVLGSRGLTEFILDTIAHLPAGTGLSARDLLTLAERAGYSIPTTRTLSKRLTERSYRVGDIEFNQNRGGWMKSILPPRQGDV